MTKPRELFRCADYIVYAEGTEVTVAPLDKDPFGYDRIGDPDDVCEGDRADAIESALLHFANKSTETPEDQSTNAALMLVLLTRQGGQARVSPGELEKVSGKQIRYWTDSAGFTGMDVSE